MTITKLTERKKHCCRLYKKERKKYLANLDKKFWKTVKPLFSEKAQNVQKITIVKDRNLLSKDEDVSEILNDYFKNAVTSLDINENKFLLTESNGNSDPIDHILKRYRLQPSVLKIKE